MDASATDMSAILDVLRSIRIGIYIAISILAGIGLLVVFRLGVYIRSQYRQHKDETFEFVAKDLFEKNELVGLADFAQAEIKKRPNNSYAHWWLARAYFVQQRWDDAANELSMTLKFSPDWKDKHIDPFLRAIESEREKASIQGPKS